MDQLTGIGLMSGTSLDGVDLCKSIFYRDKNEQYQFKILETRFTPYPLELVNKIQSTPLLPIVEVKKIELELSQFWSTEILKLNLNNVDYIANHGQTIYHQAQEKISIQLANNFLINQQTQIPVIGDFRNGDHFFNGQGAPLIPICEEHLFPNYQHFLNLGGFANLSTTQENQFTAIDIGPCNILTNELCQQLGLDYDQDGLIAKNNEHLITKQQTETFQKLLSQCTTSKHSLSYEDLTPIKNYLLTLPTSNAIALNTLSSAQYCASQINRYTDKNQNILCTGGGVYNKYFTDVLKNKLNSNLIIPDTQIIDFKEALAFAFMGALKLWNKPFIYPNYTGSKIAHNACAIYSH